MRRSLQSVLVTMVLVGVSGSWGIADDAAPATQPVDKLPHLEVDAKKKQVRLECEEINAKMPLEFFCCAVNSNEHETVMRSAVKASHLHLALLMLGLEPGEPVRYSEALKKVLPPKGPPLQISAEFEKDGKKVVVPAYRMMRSTKTHKEMAPMTWVFTGSRMSEGKYAADVTGYLITIVNFDLTVIDVPDVVSSSNDTLEWEINPDVVPPKGTKVWLIIEPAGKEAKDAAEGKKDDAKKDDVKKDDGARKAADPKADAGAGEHLSDVHLDEAKLSDLHKQWDTVVAPLKDQLQTAAQKHYEVIANLRREQQRLIDEADRVQRTIDQLEKQYQDMTTPRPG